MRTSYSLESKTPTEQWQLHDERMAEFKAACASIIEFLRKHYSPHYTAIVTGTHIKLVCDELNTPMLDGYDEGEERENGL